MKQLTLFSVGDLQHPELLSEMELILKHSEARKHSQRESFFKTIFRRECLHPIAIMVGFFAFQQLSGIFVVVVYAAKFVTASGATMDPFLCAVYIGVARVVASIVVAFLLDKFGRRQPTIYSTFLMAGCMFGLALWSKYPNERFYWVPVFLIIAYVFTSTLGLLTIPFVMNAEIFPQKYRGFASGITACAGYTICFFCVKSYPDMLIGLGNFGVCMIYGGFCLLSIFYVHFLIPETKGKTLADIETMFKKLPNYDEENKANSEN